MTFSSGGFELFSEVTEALEVPQLAARTSWLQGDRGPAQHAHAMASLSCLRSLRSTPGLRSHRVLQFPLVVGTWNLERCYFPDPSGELMKTWDIALLSEMDSGMARTGQVDTPAYLAAKLGMASIYGVEFLELGVGNAREQTQCQGEVNGQGLHGNAVMSRTALEQPLLFRLDQDGRWFAAGSKEPRIGGRCAVAARVATELGPLWVVSAHLEYSDSAQVRAHTFHQLLCAMEGIVGDGPIVVGGDLNTFEVKKNDTDAEPLFALATGLGYVCHGGAAHAPTTRPSRTSPNAQAWKLDWLFTRGLKTGASRVIPALDSDGLPLSDHDAVVVSLLGLT
ncbi:MAG: hypothetical protein RL459_293 [Pseudomonadota bacterium]